MKELKFKISETSLRYGIYNNYKKGHTASVETELNQSRNPNKWRNDIFELRKMNCRCKNELIPEGLIEACLRSKKNDTKVLDIFVFKNIMVNGEKIDIDVSFCMYIKEEISETARVINADTNTNTHLGRQMIHYPISFDYKKDGFNIDNKAILEKIMKMNGDYAFVVKGFIYYQEIETLNFLITLVGPSGILQTSVFKEGKGVGKKLKVTETLTFEDNVVVTTCKYNKKTGTTNIEYEQVNKVRSQNGLKGEEFIYAILEEKLLEENDLFHTSKTYKYSPYDMEYVEDGIKKYIEVKTTQSSDEIFNLSAAELKFMEEHKENYFLYMVTEINSAFPSYKIYNYNDIKRMKKVPTNYRVSV